MYEQGIKTIELDPHSAVGYSCVACYSWAKENFEEGIRILEEIHKDNVPFVPALFGCLHGIMGQLKRARDDIIKLK